MSRPARRATGPRRPGTYVFCLFESASPTQLAGVPDGPRGLGPVRVLRIDGRLWAAVADAPAGRFSEAAIRAALLSVEQVGTAALAHEAVVRFFFRRRAVIPLKMYTIYASDDRVVADLRLQAARLVRLLGRLAGRQEWGVTLAAGRTPRSAKEPAVPTSGREYLQARRRAISNATRRSPSDAAGALMRALSPGTVEQRLVDREPESGGPAVAAAFLVDRARLPAWRKRMAGLRARLAPDGWKVSVTGPWPAYSFIGALDGD